jgi:hypothetical protein
LSPGELASNPFQDLTEAVIASRRRPTPGAVNKNSGVTLLANSPPLTCERDGWEPSSAGAEFGHDQAYHAALTQPGLKERNESMLSSKSGVTDGSRSEHRFHAAERRASGQPTTATRSSAKSSVHDHDDPIFSFVHSSDHGFVHGGGAA